MTVYERLKRNLESSEETLLEMAEKEAPDSTSSETVELVDGETKEVANHMSEAIQFQDGFQSGVRLAMKLIEKAEAVDEMKTTDRTEQLDRFIAALYAKLRQKARSIEDDIREKCGRIADSDYVLEQDVNDLRSMQSRVHTYQSVADSLFMYADEEGRANNQGITELINRYFGSVNEEIAKDRDIMINRLNSDE